MRGSACAPGGKHFASHPVRHRENHATRCVPIVIHGDAFPCMGVGKSWGKLMDSWSWSSLISKSRSKFSVFLIFCLPNAFRGTDTLGVVYQKMVWSFGRIWTGKYDMKNWDGSDIHDDKALPHTHVLFQRNVFLKGCLLRIVCFSRECLMRIMKKSSV